MEDKSKAGASRLPPAAQRRYWRRVRQLSLVLLALWFAITFLSVWYARELSGISLLGWPVSFYLAAQGAILVYVAIVGLYALAMRRLDRATMQQAGHVE